MLEETKAQNILVYAIGLGNSVSRGTLKDFSEVTGGRAFFVNKAEELAGVYQRIALELRRQYYLTYSTSNKVFDGRWIKIRVEHDNSDYKVRARSATIGDAVRSELTGCQCRATVPRL